MPLDQIVTIVKMADPIKYTDNDAAKLNRQAGPRPDTGYAVNIPNVSANDSENWTARLIKPNNKYLNLWIEEASIDFSVSGTFGQSRWKREFFPRSFNQPILKLSGHMPNQKEYNKFAAFVRESHSEALSINPFTGTNATERTTIKTKTYPNAPDIPLPTVSLIMKKDVIEGRLRNQKGGRRGMKLEGYIKSIKAGAERFQYAPEFMIEFVIAASDGNIGIYSDNLIAGSKITDWMTLFKENHFGAKSGAQIRKEIGQQDAAKRVESQTDSSDNWHPPLLLPENTAPQPPVETPDAFKPGNQWDLQ